VWSGITKRPARLSSATIYRALRTIRSSRRSTLIGAIVVAGIAILVALYRRVRGQAVSEETATLMRMIDVAVAQARRGQRDVKAGYVGSVVLVIVGALISYIWHIRLHLPGIQAMLLTAASLVIAMVLCLQGHHYARKSRDIEARFEYLKRALSASNG